MGDPLTVRDAWYGYPTCFSVWDPSSFSGLKTGSSFVLSPSASYDDAACDTNKAIPPRLSFQAHSGMFPEEQNQHRTAKKGREKRKIIYKESKKDQNNTDT